MSVFISWSGADRDVKNVIASKLYEENIPYWDSDEHCSSDFSKECIENIHRSQVFVVIISDASMNQASYVFNEVIEARKMENDGRLNIVVYKITDSPYTDRFSMQLNHISDANCVSRVRKLGSTGGIESLIKRVKVLLKRRAEGDPEKPYDVLLPRVVGLPITRGGYFVEDSRNGVLEELREAFSSSNVVILSKLFGFGKKSLIRKYITSASYTTAVEVQGMNTELRRFFLEGLHFSNVNDNAFDLEDEGRILQAKFDCLSKLDERHIIVVSDVRMEDESNETLCKLLGGLRCRIALITQDSADAYRDDFPVIGVGRMEPQYLRELFFHYYDREGVMDREPLLPALHCFFDEVGGHTKTVEVAASVLSREMRARPDDLLKYLSAGSDQNRALEDRIVEKLSDLITMECFEKDAREALVLIALLADPIIEESELLGIMTACGISRARILSELESHRWISFDVRNRTVYIEPIIAQICAARLMEDMRIPSTVFSELIGKQWERLAAKDAATCVHFFARSERFFRLLHMDELAELFALFRSELISENSDLGRIGETLQRFDAWYQSMRAAAGETPSEREQFMTEVSLWAKVALQPTLKMKLTMQNVWSLSGAQRAASVSYEDLLNEVFGDFVDDPMAMDTVQRLFDGDPDAQESKFSTLYSNIVWAFLSGDIDTVSRNFVTLIDYIETEPELLESAEEADQMLLIVKTIYTSCLKTGAYQTAISIFERLVGLNWKSFHLHRVLLSYATLLNNYGEGDFETAISVMTAAEELMEEIACDTSISLEVRENTRKEHTVLYAYTLARGGEVDEAIEKFGEFRALGESDRLADIMDTVSAIVNRLFYLERGEEAISFVRENLGVIERCAQSELLSSSYRENAESLLSMGAGDASAEVSEGGVVSNESYYQKYSAKKKNDLLSMMAYKRIANEAEKFDFSDCADGELAELSAALRARAAAGEPKKKLAPEAFALVSEAGFRVLGYRHHHVQYLGAAAMLDGKIAEILNGEGKTYTVALVAYVNSLYHKTACVLDDSKYLTERNYKWMRGLYTLLGCRVRYLSPRDSRLAGDAVKDADIVYSDFATFAFNCLYGEKDRNRIALSELCAIVDEADAVLIEAATQPFMVSRTADPDEENLKRCQKVYALAEKIRSDTRYCTVNRRGRIELKGNVAPLIERLFYISREDIHTAAEWERIKQLIRRAIACFRMVKGEDYFIRNGEILTEDTRNGTGQRVAREEGYFLALINGLPLKPHEERLCERTEVMNIAYAYGLLKQFATVTGTSATACSFKKEFDDIYGLEVVAIPTARPISRIDQSVRLFVTKAYKDAAIVDMIEEKHATEQPVLLIVRDLRESAHFSRLLAARGVPHKVLNAENAEQSPELLATAGVAGSVLIATQIANRGVDIKLGGDAERMAIFALVESGVDISDIDGILYTLPNEEMRERELYRTYSATLAQKRAVVSSSKRRVVDAGGLCVISSEPYADMRVEQQIRGRAGRQGEVGESYVFESMDDELLDPIMDTPTGMNLRRISDGLELIGGTLFLDAAIERYKKRMHHASFRRMARAAEISGRLEKSKKIFFELIESTEDGTCTDLDTLLSVWANDSENVEKFTEILEEETAHATSTVAKLCRRYPEIFDQDFDSADEYLFFGARLYADSGLLQSALSAILRRKWEEHASAMYDLEWSLDPDSVKNSKESFAQMYESDFQKKLSEAVDLWFRAFLEPKRRVRISPPPSFKNIPFSSNREE